MTRLPADAHGAAKHTPSSRTCATAVHPSQWVRRLAKLHLRSARLCHARVRAARQAAIPQQAETKTAGFDFIEGWYNPRRRQSALDYMAPAEYERRN